MRPHLLAILVIGWLPATAQAPVTFESMLRELTDLERLTRWPAPAYTTQQWSSTDRRTVAPDRPGWFANADGFGREPIPAFERVLREPGADGVGEYLLCDMDGPGAIVRGWSAGMHGELRVWLDGRDEPLFQGKGQDFLARRSSVLVPDFADLPESWRQLLQQEDADYLPVPFARHLRVCWTGRVRDLHFYQLQVRRYAAGTEVVTFAPRALGDGDLSDAALRHGAGASAIGAEPAGARFELEPGAKWEQESTVEDGGELEVLRIQLASGGPAAWRSLLLRIAFDGSEVPQVEAPLGDFAGAGPGLPPLCSLAFDTGDGLECRWPMPFRRSCRIELLNHGPAAVAGQAQWRTRARAFGADSMYFHALWRVDHELHAYAGKAPIDLPYLTAIGQGRLCGLACQIVNPPMQPSWRSNWWGEGDEKIAVDGAFTTIGTGSEDYFNYSWSHWRRFDFPYCGQPLSTGPGNCGYASNHRLQVIDDLPFEHSLAVAMELWSHKEVAPLSYARIAWFYARPGVVTDHRALQPDELHVPRLLPWSEGDFPAGGDSGCWLAREPGRCVAAEGRVDPHRDSAFTRSGQILAWTTRPGGELSLPFAVPGDGSYRLRVCCQQRPGAPAVQVLLDGDRLRIGERDTFALDCACAERFEDLVFDNVTLVAGEHALALRCPAGGQVGVDLVGYELQQPPPRRLPGASEAEQWPVLRQTDGLEIEVQQLGAGASAGRHRWVKSTRIGDAVTFSLAADAPGRYRVVLRLTTSWDYGIVRIDWNGERASPDIDLFCGDQRRIGAREVDLGARDLSQPAELTFTVTGHAEQNEAPHCYFGIDCAVLEAQ